MARLLLFALACAGCALPGSVESTGSGVTTGLDVRELSCGSSAVVERYLAGSGAMHITISDGDHVPAYNESPEVAGEIDDSRDLEGTPGAWHLAVDPQGFAGQFKITLSCL